MDAAQQHSQGSTKVAILGDDPIINRGLQLLLNGVGYETLLSKGSNGRASEVELDGVDIVLLGPALGDDRRETFLSSMKSSFATACIPVLTLSTVQKEAFTEDVGLVPWPCNIEDLEQRIESALRG
jgi:DNA-binding response OmpR family regulator